jgi:hypothetical protein
MATCCEFFFFIFTRRESSNGGKDLALLASFSSKSTGSSAVADSVDRFLSSLFSVSWRRDKKLEDLRSSQEEALGKLEGIGFGFGFGFGLGLGTSLGLDFGFGYTTS